jgi:hypothetical protein
MSRRKNGKLHPWGKPVNHVKRVLPRVIEQNPEAARDLGLDATGRLRNVPERPAGPPPRAGALGHPRWPPRRKSLDLAEAADDPIITREIAARAASRSAPSPELPHPDAPAEEWVRAQIGILGHLSACREGGASALVRELGFDAEWLRRRLRRWLRSIHARAYPPELLIEPLEAMRAELAAGRPSDGPGLRFSALVIGWRRRYRSRGGRSSAS